jgi:phosphoglycerate dehydrogenase-like enzyme
MSKTPYKVYVIQGRGQRDYADCQAALAHVPAHVETLTFIGDAAEVIERTRDADALIVTASPVTRRVMEALEGLKVVVRGGVGYDVIDVPAATDLGVVVVNIPDLWIREVANHALALLLAWNRKIVTLDREIRSGVWNSRVPGAATGALHGETVGIVGLGNIGGSFARRVAALETRVVACDPYVDDARFAALGVERVGLEDLASRSDYVSVHTLLNAETHHLIGERFFGRMKPTALLINTSRGPVVDERALIRALQEGGWRGRRSTSSSRSRWPPTIHCCRWTTSSSRRMPPTSRRPPSPRSRAAAGRRSRACSPMHGPCTWSTRTSTPPAITAGTQAAEKGPSAEVRRPRTRGMLPADELDGLARA